MGMPVSLAHMVNTLRADVDASHDQVRHQLFEAARLRQADDRTVHEILDRLKLTLSQRFMGWFEDGQFEEALKQLGQQPKAPEKPTVAFPKGPNGT